MGSSPLSTWSTSGGTSSRDLKPPKAVPFHVRPATNWNGRVAMMGFVWVCVQEIVQGKGCITRIQEAQGFGDLVAPIAIGGVFFALVLALVTVIASSNEDDFFASEEILTELKNL